MPGSIGYQLTLLASEIKSAGAAGGCEQWARLRGRRRAFVRRNAYLMGVSINEDIPRHLRTWTQLRRTGRAGSNFNAYIHQLVENWNMDPPAPLRMQQRQAIAISQAALGSNFYIRHSSLDGEPGHQQNQ
jgi:hypothetical protein